MVQNTYWDRPMKWWAWRRRCLCHLADFPSIPHKVEHRRATDGRYPCDWSSWQKKNEKVYRKCRENPGNRRIVDKVVLWSNLFESCRLNEIGKRRRSENSRPRSTDVDSDSDWDCDCDCSRGASSLEAQINNKKIKLNELKHWLPRKQPHGIDWRLQIGRTTKFYKKKGTEKYLHISLDSLWNY